MLTISSQCGSKGWEKRGHHVKDTSLYVLPNMDVVDFVWLRQCTLHMSDGQCCLCS